MSSACHGLLSPNIPKQLFRMIQLNEDRKPLLKGEAWYGWPPHKVLKSAYPKYLVQATVLILSLQSGFPDDG